MAAARSPSASVGLALLAPSWACAYELFAGFAMLGIGIEALLQLVGGPPALHITAGGLYLGLAAILYHYRAFWPQPFGWANRITLIRGAAVMLLAGAGLFPEFLSAHVQTFVLLALGCLLLDGVDGWIARRTGASGAFGARFDMEVDAFFLLVLSALIVALDKAGSWALAIGLARYVFVIAQGVCPPLRRPLPASRLRKIACVWQGATLLGCLWLGIGSAAASSALLVSLALLMLSFGRDIVWLLRRADRPLPAMGRQAID
ncbi:CDP-alcohol phosphatidyltransferase [Salinisphaera sp. T5B8]|uniref:CDP-alcohol phosphatidyltransferase family protein n=1 Tax=Salinisphaera sp. T5B8 TaxID=1304154 RepID=UPI00333F061B